VTTVVKLPDRDSCVCRRSHLACGGALVELDEGCLNKTAVLHVLSPRRAQRAERAVKVKEIFEGTSTSEDGRKRTVGRTTGLTGVERSRGCVPWVFHDRDEATTHRSLWSGVARDHPGCRNLLDYPKARSTRNDGRLPTCPPDGSGQALHLEGREAWCRFTEGATLCASTLLTRRRRVCETLSGSKDGT